MEKFIPVVVIKELSETDKILTALKNYGINCAEITFRTACAAEAIEYACKNYPDMSVGAGTVINAEQCEAALRAGAQFIVSPGLSVSVAKICSERNIPYYPGCVTPTEIMQALELGITTVKFFPANVYGGLKALKAGAQFIVSPGLSVSVAKICNEKNIPYYPGCVTPTEIMQALELGITTVKFFPANVYGGLKALKALSAPFPQVKFIPTGGVDRSNIDEFLAFDKIAAIGGSFFVKEALDKAEEK